MALFYKDPLANLADYRFLFIQGYKGLITRVTLRTLGEPTSLLFVQDKGSQKIKLTTDMQA